MHIWGDGGVRQIQFIEIGKIYIFLDHNIDVNAFCPITFFYIKCKTTVLHVNVIINIHYLSRDSGLNKIENIRCNSFPIIRLTTFVQCTVNTISPCQYSVVGIACHTKQANLCHKAIVFLSIPNRHR